MREVLSAGLDALKTEGVPIRAEKFPVVVDLRPGRGVSHSVHGRGPIELFHVGRRAPPVIHELTHVLAGYTRANGHWSTEGLASYLQDKYSAFPAFPTFREAHAVARLLIDRGEDLPMVEIMRDRDREGAFGMGDRWRRWLACSQATSFVRYLVERHGMARFMQIYDRAYEDIPFDRVYGRPAAQLIADWRQALKAMTIDPDDAESVYRRMNRLLR